MNGDQQKRSLSYGDKLNSGNNGNRRQLPPAPANTTSTTNKLAKNPDPQLEGDSDLKVREPTPDYDTQSMLSNIPPPENSRSEAKIRREDRRNSADSTTGSNGNGKRKLEGSRSVSSNGSVKEAPNSHTHQKTTNQTNGKVHNEEKGKQFSSSNALPSKDVL